MTKNELIQAMYRWQGKMERITAIQQPVWVFPCHRCEAALNTLGWEPGMRCANCGAVVPRHPNAPRTEPKEQLPLVFGPFPHPGSSTEFLGACPHCDAQVVWPDPHGNESFDCPSCGGTGPVILMYVSNG